MSLDCAYTMFQVHVIIRNNVAYQITYQISRPCHFQHERRDWIYINSRIFIRKECAYKLSAACVGISSVTMIHWLIYK